jgi:hypothetical protein
MDTRLVKKLEQLSTLCGDLNESETRQLLELFQILRFGSLQVSRPPPKSGKRDRKPKPAGGAGKASSKVSIDTKAKVKISPPAPAPWKKNPTHVRLLSLQKSLIQTLVNTVRGSYVNSAIRGVIDFLNRVQKEFKPRFRDTPTSEVKDLPFDLYQVEQLAEAFSTIRSLLQPEVPASLLYKYNAKPGEVPSVLSFKDSLSFLTDALGSRSTDDPSQIGPEPLEDGDEVTHDKSWAVLSPEWEEERLRRATFQRLAYHVASKKK